MFERTDFMEKEEILTLAIKRLKEFKEEVGRLEASEEDLEIKLGDSFIYFFKIYENSGNLKIFEENTDFLLGIKQIWNAFKHNQRIVLIQRIRPFILNDSKLNGTDVIMGKTTWREEISQSGNKPKGTNSIAFYNHVQPLDVSETLAKLISISENALKELKATN